MLIKMLLPILLSTISFFCQAMIMIGVGEWSPYVNNEHTGLADKRVSCLLNSAGIEYEYKFYPWSRVYRLIASKQLDISYPWSRNEERNHQVLFSDAILFDREVLVYQSNKGIKINSLNDLKKYRVGALNGFSHVEYLEKNNITPAAKVKTEEQLLGMLYSGRVEVIPINISILERIIPNLTEVQIQNLEISSINFIVNTMHIIAKKDDAGHILIDKINKEISKNKCKA
ncbi:substrate-binding periplasmic protein [Aeromonas dhakensis]|uniref:substrate-binding periplasmic protein n=2 Tax=Aeromonas dhakensis TaxID=196024 RepID=UPI003985F2D0